MTEPVVRTNQRRPSAIRDIALETPRRADAAANGTLALERFLPYRLSILTNTVSASLAERYASRFRMTIPEWRVMAVLARFPDLSATDISRATAMDKATASRAVARLVRAGRVLRRIDPADRRRVLLRLSATGTRVYREIVPAARTYEKDLLAALSEDEAAQLDALLAKLHSAAQAIAP